MDLSQPMPVVVQQMHRRLRELINVNDPYREKKNYTNHLAMELFPSLKEDVESSSEPLFTATRLAIAGNVIDFGVTGNLQEDDIRMAVKQALIEPFYGEWEKFRNAVAKAQSILYLADNAGEIVFDRLLIEQLSPERVTLVVRGGPIINDATIADVQAVGLDKIVKVIDNGSDAPGTILNDCHPAFQRLFFNADLVISKGQGNFDSLSREPGNLFFLLKVKMSGCRRLHQPTHRNSNLAEFQSTGKELSSRLVCQALLV